MNCQQMCYWFIYGWLNGALFFKATSLFLLLALSVLLTVIFAFMTIYASLELRNSDLSIGVLNLTFLLRKY